MLLPPDAAAPSDEFAYLIPLEKFVLRRGGEWAISEPLGKEGLKNHLAACGWSPGEVATVLKTYSYLKVYGAELAPNQPPIFRDSHGHDFINLWIPPTLKPVQGPYPRIEQILSWVTCGDKNGEAWLRQWLAAKVQTPTYVPKVAVVLTSVQGAGKGTLAFLLSQMLGPKNCTTVKREELGNRFNARWIGKLFVLGDELLSADNVRDVSDLLKVLIDGNELELERKGKDQRSIRNRLAWMFASNDEVAPVVLEFSDRRYSVFSNHSKLTSEYDQLLKSCFCKDDRGRATPEFEREIAGFYYDLMQMPVDHQLITRPYQNESRQLLIDANLPTHKLFCQHVDAEGIDDLLEDVLAQASHRIVKTRPEWDFGDQGISTSMLYRCYVEFCRRSGGKWLKLNRFGVAIRRHLPPWKHVRNTVPGSNRQVNCYVVPRSKT